MVVNVWDADRKGASVPANIACQLSNHDLDEGPFDPNQICISFGHYHILSEGYDLFEDDPVLGFEGTDYVYGTPYGLIAPGEGPGLRIRAAHEGRIILDVARHGSEPAADFTVWETAEQVTIRPAKSASPVRWGRSNSTTLTSPAAARLNTLPSGSAYAGETTS